VNPWYVVLFAALIVAAVIVGWWRSHIFLRAVQPAPEPAGIERLYREPVVVTMKTGESFSGLLFEHTDREIVLRGAHGLQMAPDGRDNLPIDGEVLIFIRDIAYMQKP